MLSAFGKLLSNLVASSFFPHPRFDRWPKSFHFLRAPGLRRLSLEQANWILTILATLG